MRTDGEATRARILAAAREEFSRHGLAGARVDRIAAEARASKERLYAYFGSKNTLFAEVLAGNLRETTEEVPRDALDLPGFVGALYDHAVSNPEHVRMLDWARLEGAPEMLEPGSRPGPTSSDVAAAQAKGIIDPAWDPDDLMTLLFSLATAWVQSPEVLYIRETDGGEAARERRRQAAIAAACRLIAPPEGAAAAGS